MNLKKFKGSTTTTVLIVVVIVAFLAGIGYVTYRLGVWGNKSGTSQSGKSGKIDEQLVGTWTSACLVPDVNSPWSEKHQFTINKDGTATHIRWSSDGHDCAPTMTLTDNYQYSIPKTGQIDLNDTEKGMTLYDIYQVSGGTLLFGHGFRNTLPYPSQYGGSASSRIDSLNGYIVYTK